MADRKAILKNVSRRSRKIRRPVHPHSLKFRPWEITPFLIAPVLPGETMRNALLQQRCVTDPVASRLVGWHLEHYFFYVRHRAMRTTASDALQSMMLEPEDDASTLNEAADAEYYHGATKPNYVKECLRVVTEEYFRDEGESWDVVTSNGLPVASAGRQNWADSLVGAADYVADGGIGEEESITVGGDGLFTAQEVEDLMQKWRWQRMVGATEMDYEDWLATYGVSTPEKDDEEKRDIPELLRFTRNWQYPSNTIDPSDGSATSAVSWSITERADKDRFFREPGFIFGCQIARPKVYWKNQVGTLTSFMDTGTDWLPALLAGDELLGLKEFASSTGPISGYTTENYWVDMRDLFMYGEQFVNHALTDTDANIINLPSTTDLSKRYPATTDMDNMFTVTTAGVSNVHADGITTLQIASSVRDFTATT